MDVKKVRNVALVAQNSSGKTSLAEAMLYTAKATKRLGKVDDGSSVLDFEPEELKRHISISTAFHHLTWKKTQIFLMDTPGDDNFLAEAENALHVADNCIFTVDGVTPVKPQTEKVWEMIKKYTIPVLMHVNKMDKERADFFKAVDALKDLLEVRLVPVAIPIGSHEEFKGIVDLIQMKAYTYDREGSGKGSPVDIPDDLRDQAEELRANLIEFAAESDDELLEKFLEGEELSPDEILDGLKKGILDGGFVPVSCGSATMNMGTDRFLNLVADFLASPEDRGAVAASNPKSGGDVEVAPNPDDPVAGLVFKTLTDPYAGRLSILRIYSGTLKPDGTLYNPNKDANERYSQIMLLEGKEQKPTDAAGPGYVVALAKLKETTTGDTLCDQSRPVQFPFVESKPGLLTYAIKPRSRGDEEKITQALQRLQEEDPTLVVRRDPETNELLISGNGQVHIDTTIEKLQRKFGVEVDLTTPKIPYRETIKAAKKGVIYRHKKQTGGAGQFAEVHFDISPLPRGQGFEFEEALVGMNVPRNFVPAVEKGLHEAMQKGPLAGYPVVDVKVRFYDGKSHEVDSSEIAFKIASIQCFKKGVLDAKPTLLEPIMKLTIHAPDDAVGDIMGDLSARRGKVMGMQPGEKGKQVIEALVPLSEIQKYVLDLNAMTQGRGTFTMEFSHYEEVPPDIAQRIIEQAKQDKG